MEHLLSASQVLFQYTSHESSGHHDGVALAQCQPGSYSAPFQCMFARPAVAVVGMGQTEESTD